MDLIIDQVVHYNEEMMPLRREQLMQEGEIGPIKYVAEVIYGQEKAPDMVDNAVRWVIFALIFVFDPLAVLLLVSSAGLIAGKDKVVVKNNVAPVKKKTPVAKPQEKVTNKIVFQVPKDRVLDLSKDK
jgi:hypothetical protein